MGRHRHHHHRSKRVSQMALSSGDDEEQHHSRHPKRKRDSSLEQLPRSHLSADDRMEVQQQQQQPAYVFRTIRDDNRNRLSILPIFPTTANDRQHHLLLANVPAKSLSKEEESLRRAQSHSTIPFRIHLDHVHYSSDLVEYYQRNYVSLINRFNIDATILDCNYNRLRHCLNLFANDRIRHLRTSFLEVQLPEQERSMAMEFFLQIDVDVFYMKNEHLFCQHEPDLRFTLRRCGQCELCCLPYYSIGRPSSPLHFGSFEKFVFINGYETILNAHASCDSQNIIYVLKCPCNAYEYVGETNLTLRHCLARIRETSMRHMHEFLLGEKNFPYIHRRNRQNQAIETSCMDHLHHLYQHVVRCPIAMQLFLDYNSRYWRFVPMPMADIEEQNAIYVQQPKNKTNAKTETNNQDDQLQTFLNNLPIIPRGYQFSEQQYDQQVRFFQKERHTHLPRIQMDLYKATIIVVLPKHVSNVFRQFIQALFITHGETNLNSIGHLLPRDNKNNHNNNMPLSLHNLLPRGEWCRNLVRRSL